jgi:hypothetical protein
MMNGNFSGLAPGDYNIWVKDANDCLLTAGYTVLSPAAIVFDGEATSVLCNGDENGFISFGATGGSGEFEYSVNGGEFSNVSAYADLAAGDYAVVAQDVLTGCTAELLLSVDENSAVELTATVADASCNGDEDGSIMAMGAGGMMPYTYSIDGGAPQANGTFDDLAAGDYDVTVTDDNGCSVTETITVTEPAALTVDSDVVGDDGSGNGEIDITVTGGTPNYSYEWSGPGGFSSTSQDIDGLDGGSYTVTVTDENDCEITETIVVSTGIEEFFNGITVEVYPNPSNGEFVLTLSGMNGETINLNIVDALGRNVINTQLNGAGVVRHDINLNNVEGGVYFLQLVADGAAHVTRLIKQ